MIINVSGEVLYNVAQFAAKHGQSNSFVLNALHFEVKKDCLTIIATDGGAACVYTKPQASAEEGIFTVEIGKRKFLKKYLYAIYFQKESAFFFAIGKKNPEELKYISDARFPNVYNIIPSQTQKASEYVPLCPENLVKLQNCICDAPKQVPFQYKKNGPCLWVNDNYKVILAPYRLQD